ncbi:hypothetical protein GGI20_001272 [Coemansia sp. BCRC 34301]|nr:hypothetical protein GGI20_001272 [Coemansia sp. BCRC 34301]
MDAFIALTLRSANSKSVRKDLRSNGDDDTAWQHQHEKPYSDRYNVFGSRVAKFERRYHGFITSLAKYPWIQAQEEYKAAVTVNYSKRIQQFVNCILDTKRRKVDLLDTMAKEKSDGITCARTELENGVFSSEFRTAVQSTIMEPAKRIKDAVFNRNPIGLSSSELIYFNKVEDGDENMVWKPKPGCVYEFAQSADSGGVSISLCFKTAGAKAKLKACGITGAATRVGNRANIKSSGAELAATTDASAMATTDARTSGKEVCGKRKRKPAAKPANDCGYIQDIKFDNLDEHALNGTSEEWLYCDPGYRDLLYFADETSTTDKPKILRLNINKRSNDLKQRCYARVRRKMIMGFVEPDADTVLLATLFADSVADPAANSDAVAVSDADAAPRSPKPMCKSLVKQVEARLSEYSCKTVDPTEFKEYIAQRAEEWPLLSDFYNSMMTRNSPATQRRQWELGREPRSYPTFCKLRSLAFINKEKTDAKLLKKLRKKFSRAKHIVFGNWFAPHTRHQQPIRGKGWRALFKRAGCNVLLLDEFRMSCICPNCSSRLENFCTVKNPRPFCRGHQPTEYRRYFNCDTVGVLNFMCKIKCLKQGLEVPEVFWRPTGDECKATTKRKAADDGQTPAKRQPNGC